MSTIIDTPHGIEQFGLLSLRAAVKLEARGMRRRGESAVRMAKRVLGRRGVSWEGRPITPGRRVPATVLIDLLTTEIGQ